MDEGVGISAEGVGGFVRSDSDCAVALGNSLVVAGKTDIDHLRFARGESCALGIEHIEWVILKGAVEHGLYGERGLFCLSDDA